VPANHPLKKPQHESEVMKSLLAATGIFTGFACLLIIPVVRSAPSPDPGKADKPAQEAASKAFNTRSELEAHYARQAAELDRRKLADLAALAGRQTGLDAEATYHAAFDLAVGHGLYSEAEPPARAYLAHARGDHENFALAASIVLIMEAERGEFDKSLTEAKEFLKRRAAAEVAEEHRLTAPLVCAVGEAYLQRVVRGGRYDIARQVCSLLCESGHPDQVVKNYFSHRLARFDMVGKPAPMFEGIDADGKPVRLADYKGKVVLIDFWASWAPPCVAAFSHLRELYHTYRDQGFTVVGVNLDSLGQDLSGKKPDSKEVLSTVRWFLLQHRAAWPDILGETAEAAAKAYSVADVPATFLVGRDGIIAHVELSGEPLSRAIEASLKTPAEKPRAVIRKNFRGSFTKSPTTTLRNPVLLMIEYFACSADCQ
jgi:thiol-disulfide isomerase/thioredoxin